MANAVSGCAKPAANQTDGSASSPGGGVGRASASGRGNAQPAPKPKPNKGKKDDSNLPKTGKKYSSKDLIVNGKVKQRRYYGKNGKVELDIDYFHAKEGFYFCKDDDWEIGPEKNYYKLVMESKIDGKPWVELVANNDIEVKTIL